MSPLLSSLIGSILVQERDIVIAGSVADEEPLEPAIDSTRADVVIICERTPEAAAHYDEPLLTHPRARFLLITDAGQHGYLYALAPTLTPLPELSVVTLLAAIRNGQNWHRTRS